MAGYFRHLELMPEQTVQLTASEQDLIGQIARFAERRAQNGCYLNMGYSKSLNMPILLFVALGEQALAAQAVLLKAQEPQTQIEVVSSLDDVGKEW